MAWIGWKAIGLGILTGGAVGAVLYTSLNPGGVPVSATIPVTSQAAPTTVFAECVPPAVLEGQECVTHVNLTTVVPAPVPAAAAVAASDPAIGQPSAVSTGRSPKPGVATRDDDDDSREHDDKDSDDESDDEDEDDDGHD